MAKKKTTIKNTEKTELSLEKLQNLRKWNIRFGVLFALQAIAIIVIGTVQSYPVTTQYLAIDALASEATGGTTLAVATRHLVDVRLGWLVGAFLLAFAAAHFAMATLYRKRYEARLQLGMNDARWAAFGVGGGLMLVATGLLSGIYGLISLAAMLVFMVIGSLAILAVEEMIRRGGTQKETLLSHLVCAVGTAGAVAPLVMLVNAAGGTLLFDGKLPSFLWGIYATILIVFGLIFWLTHLRMVRRGQWADGLRTERAYMVLGLVGASAVAWQMFAGALLP
jgi:hypothetical protein